MQFENFIVDIGKKQIKGIVKIYNYFCYVYYL
jgi:hypothetical protein